MQLMQYNAPNRMYVFQNFSRVTPRIPFWCCDSEPGPLPSKILAARLAGHHLIYLVSLITQLWTKIWSLIKFMPTVIYI